MGFLAYGCKNAPRSKGLLARPPARRIEWSVGAQY
jgi:hypothetical protein